MSRGTPRRPANTPPALPRGVRIVHEDDDIIVIDKPTGLVTADPRASTAPRVPGRIASLFDALKLHVRQQGHRGPRRDRDSDTRGAGSRAGGAPPPPVWVIHRLDKEASGLVVFAKSQRAFNWLKEDFRSKRVHRIYLAVAEGIVGEVGFAGSHQSMMRDEDRGDEPRRPRAKVSDPGKLAVTHFRVLGAGNDRSLIEARLETGRKNQIRIHLADMGHSLVGDRRFGAKTDAIGRLGLHAAELGFAHPATGQEIRFTSPAPAMFYKTVGLPVPAGVTDAPVADAVAPAPRPATSHGTSWQPVAGWYDELLADRGNDHYEQVIVPGALRLLNAKSGAKILDVACGQGILARRLAALGCKVTGIDAAAGLIDAAHRRAGEDPNQSFHVGDARAIWEVLPGAERGTFDAAACIMALSNIDSLEPVMRGVAAALKPCGALVFVVAHPAFRAIGQSAWGWDDKAARQYRRIDGYLSTDAREIEMQPGKAAHGKGSVRTLTFHRPLQAYVAALGKAGLLVESLEEWPSVRASTSGPRAVEENRARREIPMFLGVRAVLPK